MSNGKSTPAGLLAVYVALSSIWLVVVSARIAFPAASAVAGTVDKEQKQSLDFLATKEIERPAALILLGTTGVAFAAFWIWFGVRIINRREPWAIAAALVAVAASFAFGLYLFRSTTAAACWAGCCRSRWCSAIQPRTAASVANSSGSSWSMVASKSPAPEPVAEIRRRGRSDAKPV